MPPKRARVESGSSSAPRNDDVFDAHRFVSAVAESEYNKIRTKPIIKERGFIPTSADGELLSMIEERGWQVICEEPQSVPMGIIREFYANARIEKNGYSYVRGTVIDYRPKAIRSVLRQPPRPADVADWVVKPHDEIDLDELLNDVCVPGTQWKYSAGTNEHVNFLARYMNRYARAWNLFICANIMPTSHTHEITVERAILLWGILKDEYVDLGFLLYQSMLKFMQGGTSGAIPHASIVARLCAAVGVVWGNEEQLQHPMGPVDHAIISRMDEWPGGIAHHRGLGYIVEDPEDAGDEGHGDEHIDEPPPPPRQPRAQRRVRVPRAGTSRVRPAMTDSQYRRLTRRIDASHAMTRQFVGDLVDVLDRLHIDQGVHAAWPDFRDYGPYPPPDSPPEEGDASDQ